MVDCTVVVNINVSNILEWHVVVHLPIEFSISSSGSHDLFVKSLNSCFASLVICNGLVNVIDEDIEVSLVLCCNFIVSSLVLLEPCNYFLFIEVEGERMLLECCPFGFSSYLIRFWDVLKIAY